MGTITKLDDELLTNVAGGVRRTVLNKTAGYDYANVRSEPNGRIIDKVYNGESVYTTGRNVSRGGYTWCEVDYPGGGHGWISKNLLVDIEL